MGYNLKFAGRKAIFTPRSRGMIVAEVLLRAKSYHSRKRERGKQASRSLSQEGEGGAYSCFAQGVGSLLQTSAMRKGAVLLKKGLCVAREKRGKYAMTAAEEIAKRVRGRPRTMRPLTEEKKRSGKEVLQDGKGSTVLPARSSGKPS